MNRLRRKMMKQESVVVNQDEAGQMVVDEENEEVGNRLDETASDRKEQERTSVKFDDRAGETVLFKILFVTSQPRFSQTVRVQQVLRSIPPLNENSASPCSSNLTR
jgi:hypothetical protein